MDYSINEILAIAHACGVECELNTDDPGVFMVTKDGTREKVDLFELFETKED
ncbi:hypothetical protein M3664_04620 [Paenibacillus lautus]|uniref:hypothetical protein n=1 Tax=Paenibacillus lautus TaxID=1401 RepID=UPI002040E110|nr:hypothetical protein [Paenibacillus lautus]MCM3257065.1 hypothetical protein [Paenibacillus lautus]